MTWVGRVWERAMWGEKELCNIFDNEDLYFFKKSHLLLIRKNNKINLSKTQEVYY